MLAFPFQIVFVLTDFIPPTFENRCRRGLNRIITPCIQAAVFCILFTAFIVSVSPGAGVSHLNKFTRHVHTNEIILLPVSFEQLVDLFCGFQ